MHTQRIRGSMMGSLSSLHQTAVAVLMTTLRAAAAS